MTREELTDKMKDLPNPPTRVNLIQQVYDIMNEENEQLKDQIEQMKCCANCKFLDNDYMEKPCCECIRCPGDIKRRGTFDKWEI